MKGKMTVSHAKFQYYRHNYCLVCMTGMLGCRWHRYQQSTRDSRKRDIFWFSLFTLTFLYVLFYFYFWLVADNDYRMLEWYMFDSLKTYVPWYKIVLPLSCATFGYFLLVMMLYLCHIGHGHQIFIHPFHIVIIILTLAACVACTVFIDDLWNSEFHVIYLSLQMMGPFLHIGAVTIMTAMMWLLSHAWYTLSRKGFQLLWLLVIVVVMVGLYIAPLYIQCPCITSYSDFSPKPKLFAHRGAEGIAPENTVISFQKAVEYGAFGLESDVRISYDGVPFLFHDDTFQRTTNVDQIFPDQAGKDVSLFNMSQIKMLNAGSWFLDRDPYDTVGDLSEADRQAYSWQEVPTLEEYLSLARQANTVVMFDVRKPMAPNPYSANTTDLITAALQQAGFNASQMYWLVKEDEEDVAGARLIFGGAPPVSNLQRDNITLINVMYNGVDPDRIREYQANNISSNIFVVDASWFFSYYWCLGVTSITTRRIDRLAALDEPLWTLTSNSYLILWISVDVLSAIIIIVIFVVQRIRLFGTSFSPEAMSLTAARRARTYRSRTMKEKLLRDGIIEPMEDGLEGGTTGVVNHPAAYSMASLQAPPFPAGPPNVRVGPITQPDRKYEIE